MRHPLLLVLGFAAFFGVAIPQASAAPSANPNAWRDKQVVISGADGGIGVALTEALLNAGAQVLGGVHQMPPSDALAALQKAHADKLTIATLDVTDGKSVQAFRDGAKLSRVDVLLNTAGINIDEKNKILDLPEERLQATFNVNATGPVRMTQAFYPLLKKSERPKVVNISSIMGSIGDNRIAGSAAYRMSKAALNMFTKTLSIEQPDLIVLSLHPGWVKTRMGGQKAEIDPDTSATGILRVVSRAKGAQSGHFYRYTGEPAPW